MSELILFLGALLVYVLITCAAHCLDSVGMTSLDFPNLKFRKTDEPGVWHVTIMPFTPRSNGKSATISVYHDGACIAQATGAITPDVIVSDGPFVYLCLPTTRLSATIPMQIDPYHAPPGNYLVRITEHYSPCGAACTDWRKEINTEIRSR